MSIINEFKETKQYILENDKLMRRSVNGLHEENIKCNKSTENYKLFTMHFNCALPYTVYLLADRKSGIVLRYESNFSVLREVKEEM